MKRLLLLLFLLINLISTAQNTYKKGYYINNDGKTIKCLIQDIDWKNNPIDFNIKLNENSKAQKIEIKDAALFEIYGDVKFIRANVDIDKSSEALANYSHKFDPEFNNETLFLKVLVEGKANLYLYKKNLYIRYFYKVGNNPIQQLIHKKYIVTVDQKGNIITQNKGTYDIDEEKEVIMENSTYRLQIWKNVKCGDVRKSDINKLQYTKDDLIKYFTSYNTCNNSLNKIYKKEKNNKFKLALRPGLNYYSIISKDKTLHETSFRIGLELEYYLPYNNNKWSLIVEPSYESFPFTKTIPSKYYCTYKNAKLPIGGRYYMYLNDDSSIFVNILFGFDLNINSITSYKYLSLKSYVYGVGYKKNKFAFELRLKPNHNLLYNMYYPRFNTISLIGSYTLID